MKHYEKCIAYDLAFAQKLRILCGNTLNWRIFLIWKTYYKIKKKCENFQIFCDFEYFFIYVSTYIAIYTYMNNIRITKEDKTIYCGVYRITAPNGKEYVGRSKDVMQRWKSYHYENWQCSGPKLVESIKKWGVDMHNFELVEECCKDDLNKRERYYINLLQTDIKGLNSPKCDFGKKVGFKHTEATKAAMRLAKSRAIGNRSYKGKEFKGHKIRNTQTNEEWKSVTQCARHYGVFSQNVDYWLKNGKNNLIKL